MTLQQSKGMPYLQAVIQEVLRCHPAVGMSLPRVTPSGGIEICGQFIPQGVSVAVALLHASVFFLTLKYSDYCWSESMGCTT
jgi:cytochrome P450